MPEQEFFADLRSVTLHLIKHVQPHYKRFIGMVEVHDDYRWSQMPDTEKLRMLGEIGRVLPELDAYYADYPHAWSRQRYSDFKEQFTRYHDEIQRRMPRTA